MSRESTLILLGILVALSPFLGLPYGWLMVLAPLLGIAVVVIGVRLRARRLLTRDTRDVSAPLHERPAP